MVKFALCIYESIVYTPECFTVRADETARAIEITRMGVQTDAVIVGRMHVAKNDEYNVEQGYPTRVPVLRKAEHTLGSQYRQQKIWSVSLLLKCRQGRCR